MAPSSHDHNNKFFPCSLVLDNAMATEAIMNAGISKVKLPIHKMIILGVLAGVYLGFGGQLMNSILVVGDGETVGGPQKFLAGLGFSVGLMMIVGAGAELFTGNCLLIVSAMAKRITWRDLVVDWVIVYLSNFVGTILIAALIYGTGVNGYDPSDLTPTGKIACSVAVAKGKLRPHEMFLRGIGANMLVCLAILLAVASKTPTGKFVGIALPIAAFISIGFEHSIANMFIFSMATMLDCQGVGHGYYWLDLLLCTLGNILGAAFLAVNYWITYIQKSDNDGGDAAESAVDDAPRVQGGGEQIPNTHEPSTAAESG